MAEKGPEYTPVQRQLKAILVLPIRMEVVTGLLIRKPLGAQLRIGGADVWPMSLELTYTCKDEDQKEVQLRVEVPYVPGSSLKGRMRSLLELSEGLPLITTDGKIFLHVRSVPGFKKVYVDNQAGKAFYDDVVNRCPVDEVFGYASFQLEQHLRKELKLDELYKSGEAKLNAMELYKEFMAPTRLYVDDFYPATEYVCQLRKKLGRSQLYLMDFLEVKSENRIDRLTSAADPRTNVRVAPGTLFDGSLKLAVYDIDLKACPNSTVTCLARNIALIARGLMLVEELGLGASVSRGYGRVRFRVRGAVLVDPRTGRSETVLRGDVDPRGLLEKSDEIARNVSEKVGERKGG